MKSETNGLVWSLILNVRITWKISVHSKLKVSHKCSTILYGSTCHLPLPVQLFNKNRNSSQDENLILSVPGEWNFYKIPFAFFFNFIANSLRPASPNLPLITKWERVYVLCSCVWLIFLEWHRYCSPLLWSMSRGPVLTASVTGFVYLLGSLVFLCNGICVLY